MIEVIPYPVTASFTHGIPLDNNLKVSKSSTMLLALLVMSRRKSASIG